MSQEFEDAAVGWALSPELTTYPTWTEARFNDCSCDALGCDRGTCFSCVAASCSEEVYELTSARSSQVESEEDDDPMEIVPLTPRPEPAVFVVMLPPYSRRPRMPLVAEDTTDAIRLLRCEERFADFADESGLMHAVKMES